MKKERKNKRKNRNYENNCCVKCRKRLVFSKKESKSRKTFLCEYGSKFEKENGRKYCPDGLSIILISIRL